MRKAVSLFVLPALLGQRSLARAQGPEIGHKAIGCIIAGQYPKMTACFRPLGSVARGRVYFKPEAAPAWYYVEMKSDAPCHAGVLPKPTKKLINTKVLYYVQVVDKGLRRGPDRRVRPDVVEKESDCKDKLPDRPDLADGARPGSSRACPRASPWDPASRRCSWRAAPPSSAGASRSASRHKDKPTPTPAPNPRVHAHARTPTPTPTPTPTRPRRSGLAATCQAQPQSGPAPLDVAFGTFPTGGTGTYEFAWDFGDGGSAFRSNPNHTYTATGSFTRDGQGDERRPAGELLPHDHGGQRAAAHVRADRGQGRQPGRGP